MKLKLNSSNHIYSRTRFGLYRNIIAAYSYVFNVAEGLIKVRYWRIHEFLINKRNKN